MSKAAELAALIANVNKGSSLANKNFIINGAMNVAQRGTSSTGISASNYYTVDRFKCTIENTAGRLTMEQVADGPDGFANCTKLTCTTADTSIASNEALILHQNIEGQNVQSLKKGTADAVPVTVSFYVKANASATYTMELRSGDASTNRMNSQEFSVTTSWTRVELTFVGDTSQVLDDDSNASLLCNIWLHGGSDYTGGTHTDNVWHTTNNQRVGDSQTSFFDSTSRTFFITGWQLEIGEKATEFEHEPFETTLHKCERYFCKSYNYSVAVGTASYFGMRGTDLEENNQGSGYREKYDLMFPVRMRNSPTVTVYDSAGTVNKCNYYISATSTAGKTFTVSAAKDTCFGGYSDRSTTIGGWRVHFAADAEI